MAAPCLYQARHVMLGRNHYMRRDESLTDSKLQSHLFGHVVVRVTGVISVAFSDHHCIDRPISPPFAPPSVLHLSDCVGLKNFLNVPHS